MDEKKDVLVLECVKTDNDTLLRFMGWFITLMLAGGNFFSQNNPLLYLVAFSFAVAAEIYVWFRRSYRITVTDEYIEKRFLCVYRRMKPWSEVSSYRLKHTEGEYSIDVNWRRDNSGYVEEEYTILLYFGKGLPMRITNSLTNYKKFKKLLKERGVKRLKSKKKK